MIAQLEQLLDAEDLAAAVQEVLDPDPDKDPQVVLDALSRVDRQLAAIEGAAVAHLESLRSLRDAARGYARSLDAKQTRSARVVRIR